MTCLHCNEMKPLERNGNCASCNAAIRKGERNASKSKVVKPVSKVSEKRAGQLNEYAKLRKEYLELYPICEVTECHNRATEIHHQRGREGERLLDTNFFMAICPDHHREYTDNSKEAINKGYSKERNTTI